MPRWTMVVTLVTMLAACTAVDSTEHCVETRYGRILTEKMDEGLNATVFSSATCFSLTEQNYPSGGDTEQIQAQTRDPVSITGDVALVFAFDPATVGEVFREKRSQDAALAEIINGVREGFRNATAGWAVADIFSERRAEFADSVREHIARKVGNRASIRQVFVRDLKIPQAIEEARIQAARQAQVLSAARQQYQIDSVNAAAAIMRANADAEAKELMAAAYSQNPALLNLEIAKETAKICGTSQTCVIGGSVLDTWRAPGGDQ